MSVSYNEVYRMALQLAPEERQRLADTLAHPPHPLKVGQIVDLLNHSREELRAHGVERIGVFGSHVQGKAGPASDIDLLVVLNQASLTGYMRLKLYLEELFGRPVDLVLADSIRPELREQILQEVIYAENV